MGPARTLQDIRIMRFEDLLWRQERGAPSQLEAASLLGVSERTIRRWRDRHGEEGSAGLRDRRIDKPSPRQAGRPKATRPRRSCQPIHARRRAAQRQPCAGIPLLQIVISL